ncbi:hypothetical protein GCM10022277_31850 [Litoribacillus peritrichatus]|uniref:Uncharacterized protein n=1 Tax=Litoribacillus peritrichatus TaxID=718191 RepID=A0ABP7N0E5_9GAMM
MHPAANAVIESVSDVTIELRPLNKVISYPSIDLDQQVDRPKGNTIPS